jgi:uncharacterized protein
MLLIDTNVWLELLLDQEKADQVRNLFQRIDASLMAISEFSLYSIAIILIRLNKDDLFLDFLNDTIEESGLEVVRLGLNDLKEAVAATKKFNLDFDDAYQYVAGSKHDYLLVSFDADFDHTDRGRKTPGESISLISNHSAS